jgi:ABC-type ATPase involved in cell division
MIKFKNITTYEKKPYLNNFNLNVFKGKTILLNYKSDLEKNKIIDLICQLEKPKSGELFIDGKNLTKSRKKSKELYKKVGICFEDFKLVTTKNVLGNIILPLEIHTKFNKNKINELGEKQLKDFGLYSKKDNKIFTLTLEEKQRLNIARALILDPQLIILDNPENHFDTKKIQNLMIYFNSLNKLGKTILIFTNNKKVEESLNDYQKYILEKGAISNV